MLLLLAFAPSLSKEFWNALWVRTVRWETGIISGRCRVGGDREGLGE